MKTRQSNLELLRIISMSGIIFMHYVGSELGGAVINDVFPSFSWFFVHFLNSFFVPLVNCFVLISGYFMIEKQTFSMKKPIYILSLCAFYGLVSYGFAILLGVEPHEGGVLYALFPYFWGNRWFVETYIILLLFAPFLNKLLNSLSREQYHLLLIIQISVFCIWYSLGLSSPVLDNGYGIINFLTLYMMGAYIHLWGTKSKWSNLHKFYYGLFFVVCALLTFVLSYFINPYGYAFITNIIGSLVAFLFFLKWDIGYHNRINQISSATFDVYFIHSDFNTSRLLIFHLLGAKYVADTLWMIPHVIIVIVAMWLLGFATHYLRKLLFSVSIDRWLTKVCWISQTKDIS